MNPEEINKNKFDYGLWAMLFFIITSIISFRTSYYFLSNKDKLSETVGATSDATAFNMITIISVLFVFISIYFFKIKDRKVSKILFFLGLLSLIIVRVWTWAASFSLGCSLGGGC